MCATLALANAGLIAEQPAYSSLTYAAPVAYASQPASSQSFTKTISYSQPKAYVAQPALTSYQSYEPQQHYAVSSYHQQPEQHIYASPVYGHYEHGTSEQNIVRSAHGTVSQISKAVDTPHSSVRKYDTRIVNDGYKTLSYAQPAAYVQQATYAQPAAYVQQTAYAQPAVHSYTPIVAKTSVVAQPLVTKTLAQPIIAKTVVSQPAQYQYVAQPQQYQAYAQPQYQAYAQHAPVLASKVHYSPAIEVAHASFESPVAHYQW